MQLDKETWNVRIFTLLKVPVISHWSLNFFMLMLAIADPVYYTAFLISMLSVIPHEFGHIIVARHFGVNCSAVVLLPIGGVALLDDLPKKPFQELAIAIAGPIVSLLICLISTGIFIITDWQFVVWIATINGIIFLFNLLCPIFPMDGGRVIRALLAFWMDFKKATYLAVRFGQVLATALIVYGICISFWMLVISMLSIVVMAEVEMRMLKN